MARPRKKARAEDESAEEDVFTVNARVPRDLWIKVNEAAQEANMTISAYLRKALEEKWYREHRPE